MTPVIDDSTPLQAGRIEGDFSTKLSDYPPRFTAAELQAKDIAKEAVREALAEYRQEQKRGRDDRGSGDKQLGAKVRGWREAAGVTQARLGERSGLHPTTIGKIETGDRGMSFDTFCRLIAVFGEGFAWDIVKTYRYK